MRRRLIPFSAVVLLCLFANPSMAAKNSTVDTLINAAILLGSGPKLEKALGDMGSQSLEQHESVSTDAALNARAGNVVNRLLSRSARTDLKYQVKVLNKSEVNAYALPGGHLYVNAGLLRLHGVSDDELAYVLGHELAHTNKGHGLKQMKNSILTGTFLKAVAKDAKVKLYGEMTQQLFLSGRSRKDELEADAAGFDYAVSAGYDPAGGLAFMRRLETLSTGRKDLFQQFFSTHPPSHDRAEILKSKMLAQEYGADFKTPANMATLTEFSRYSGPPRNKIGLLTDKIVYLGDDRSGEKTVWSNTFYLTSEEVSRCTSAKIKFQIKAIPRKDPIVCINRTEIGRAVAKSDKWETWEFPVDPKLLRGNQANLLDMETFIPDMWRSYDDCEVKQVWLVLTYRDRDVVEQPPDLHPNGYDGFQYPVTFKSNPPKYYPGEYTQFFGDENTLSTPHYYGHLGADLATSDRRIRSASAGWVARKQKDAGDGWGNYVVIGHELPGEGVVYSLYGHLAAKFDPNLPNPSTTPNEQSRVQRGQLIGTEGNTGFSSGGSGKGIHLHFAIMSSLPKVPGGYTGANFGSLKNQERSIKHKGTIYYNPIVFVQEHSAPELPW
ncbi:MAG: M48 family metalloprotease [Armatimonadota bacterium]|nr:M48 family metalloprotease [Armatimonadota bacterium]